MAPGTAKTSRPRSSACSTVIMEPLPGAPSTTTTARASAATIRLRAGNRNWSGRSPGPYSLTTLPTSPMRRSRPTFSRG